MKTISVSTLKAHLSAQLRKVEAGDRIIVLDHKRPVAVLAPYAEESIVAQAARTPYLYHDLRPLTDVDPAALLEEDRGDRW